MSNLKIQDNSDRYIHGNSNELRYKYIYKDVQR